MSKKSLSAMVILSVVEWACQPGDHVQIFSATNATRNELSATCDSINAVIASAQAGDEIVMVDGECHNVHIDFDPVESGTAGHPIVLRPTTPLGVVFTGVSPISLRKDWLVVDGFKWDSNIFAEAIVLIAFLGSSNSIFKNNIIVNSGKTVTGTTGIIRILSGSQNNSISRNRFDALKNNGIQIWCRGDDCANTGNVISWNHFVNLGDLGLGNTGEVLQLGQGASIVDGTLTLTNGPLHTLVEHNLFENIGVTAELISNKTSENTYRYNTFRNCNDELVLRQGEAVDVYSNWFINSRGIRVLDRNHRIFNNYLDGYFNDTDTAIMLESGNVEHPNLISGSRFAPQGILIANNTIINHGAEGIYLGRNSGSEIPTGVFCNYDPDGTIVKNNLIISTRGIAMRDRASVNTDWDANVVHPSGSAVLGYDGPGVSEADPNLVTHNGLQRLQATSTAVIAQGAPITLISTDIFARSRSATSPTIGAEEWHTGEIANLPLTADQVGPGSGSTTPVGGDGGSSEDGNWDDGPGDNSRQNDDEGDPPTLAGDAVDTATSVTGGCSCDGHHGGGWGLMLLLAVILIRSRPRRLGDLVNR